tara:strand:+ start:247 stop:459 length:213 start_codon:yes stop_codon:yes gene_type:complete
MSDFPFKEGDLITIKSSLYKNQNHPREGVIVADKGHGWYDVLIAGELEQIHSNYIVTPKVKHIQFTGGVK